MSTWTIDGATVHSGGEVEGESATAMDLSIALRSSPSLARYLTAPSTIPVDLDDDWSLDAYLREFADAYDFQVESDYVTGDPPEAVQARIDWDATSPRSSDVIY
jgi:hypothetical protein